jgi:ligand-binding SRPBCC domain-containing protein
MAIHSLEKIQTIPASLENVWDFISSPKNLREITPDYMGFEITSNQLSDRMYAGQIITYKVRPLLGIPLNWCTEITHVKEHEYFVDEQRQGPYQLWHHQHHIREVKGGVEMTDIVHYQVPLGFIGELFVPLIVTPKLKDIFQYRFGKMEQLFGKI